MDYPDRIKPNEFVGPRCYFTAFDHRIISRTEDLVLLQKNIERKLKKLLLIKSKIVCAASHLTTNITFNIFKKNPFLISEGHIVPALRSDKESFSELMERKKLKEKDQMSEFYQNRTKTVVDWNLEDNSSWFRDKFVSELHDENTLIRKQLNKKLRIK